MTFWNTYEQLCNERGISPQSKEIREYVGVSSATLTEWKQKGIFPRVEYLTQISNYFGVTVDYLIGNSDQRTAPLEELESFDFALSGEIRDMSENEKQDLLDYIRFKKSQRERRQ